MKIFPAIVLILVLATISLIVAFKFSLLPIGCKKVNQT
ncbi:MAG: hypothetical protein ACD_22C00099G0002, partial [uncultured bacterium]